jgi:hypothetical protein
MPAGTPDPITHAPTMNVHQLDPAGRTVAQWCFAADILPAQKNAPETMKRKALALANRQPIRA